MSCKLIFPDRLSHPLVHSPASSYHSLAGSSVGADEPGSDPEGSGHHWESSTTHSNTPSASCQIHFLILDFVFLLLGLTQCSLPEKCHHCFQRVKHKAWGRGGVRKDSRCGLDRENKCASYLFPPGSSPLTLLKTWEVLWMFVFIKFPCLSNPQILLHGFLSWVFCFA